MERNLICHFSICPLELRSLLLDFSLVILRNQTKGECVKLNLFIVFVFVLASMNALAANDPGDILVKFKPGTMPAMGVLQELGRVAGNFESLGENWIHVQVGAETLSVDNTADILATLRSNPDVEYAQPNYTISLIEDYAQNDPATRNVIEELAAGQVAEELLPQELFNSFVSRKNKTTYSGGGHHSRSGGRSHVGQTVGIESHSRSRSLESHSGG